MNKIIRIKAGILNPDPRSLPAQLNFSEKRSRANLTGEPWPLVCLVELCSGKKRIKWIHTN